MCETFIIADTLQIFAYSPFLKLKQTIRNILHTLLLDLKCFAAVNEIKALTQFSKWPPACVIMRLAGKLKPGVTQKHVSGNSTDAPLEELHLFYHLSFFVMCFLANHQLLIALASIDINLIQNFLIQNNIIRNSHLCVPNKKEHYTGL